MSTLPYVMSILFSQNNVPSIYLTGNRLLSVQFTHGINNTSSSLPSLPLSYQPEEHSCYLIRQVKEQEAKKGSQGAEGSVQK